VTSLVLESLDFNDVVLGSPGVLFDLVLGAVNLRKAKKTPLSKLCIFDCVISAEEAATLEKVVPDFRWDRYKGDDEDDDDDDDDYDHDDDDDDDYNGDDYLDISDLGVRWIS